MPITIEDIQIARAELAEIVKTAVLNFQGRTNLIPSIDVIIKETSTQTGVFTSLEVKITVNI